MTMTETVEAPRTPRATKRVSDADKVIGRRLSAFRRLQGVSQQALGEHVGLTFQQIQKYENGTNRMSVGKVLQFAAFLKLPVGAFFEGLEGEAPNTSMPEGFSDAALRAARAIMRLPNEHSQIEVGKVCNRMVEIFEDIERMKEDEIGHLPEPARAGEAHHRHADGL